MTQRPCRSLARTLASMLVVAAGAACQAPPPDLSPPTARVDPYDAPANDPHIAVLSPELRPWLGFQMPVVIADGQAPLQVEVPVRNLSERQYLIDYRLLFYDDRGAELEPTMGWRMIALQPKQTVRLKGNALDTTADTYKLEVKWSR